MNNIITFNHNELGTMRAVNSGDMPWFVGKDVAERLGYSNPSDAIYRHIDDEDKQVVMLDIPADPQNTDEPQKSIGKASTTLINESGMYSLVLRSKLPAAKRFKRWVTSEVLPSLRRSGTYSMNKVSAEQNRILIETNNQLAAVIAKYEKLSSRLDDVNIRLDALGNMSNRQVDLLSALLQHKTAPAAVVEKAVAEKATVIEFSPEALGVRAMAKEFNVKLKPFVEWLINHHIFRRNKYGNLCLTDRYEKCTDSFQISTFKRWNMEEPSVSVRVTAKGRKIIWDAIQPDISEMRKAK